MNIERSIYQTKQEYVRELQAWLSANPDFKRIDYVRLFGMDEEFIRIDMVTGPIVINVTGNSLLAIAVEMAKLVAGVPVESIVTNINKLRAVDKVLNTRRYAS